MAFISGVGPSIAGAVPLLPPNANGFPLSLGGVVFYDEEHPETLSLPLTQKVATSDLIGGGKVLQSLGTFPSPVTWKGHLWNLPGGVSVFSRIAQLNRMLTTGAIQKLSYGQFVYNVVLTAFQPDIHVGGTWAEYSITVEVLSDSSGQYSTPTNTSVDTQTQTLSTQVQTQFNNLSAQDATVASWQTTLTQIIQGLNALGPIATATNSQIVPILQNITSLLVLVNAYVLNSKAITPTATTGLTLSNALAMQAGLTVIQKNLQSGQPPTSMQVLSGDLRHIAAQVYGDATLWTVIASANNLYTPKLPNGILMTLTIPPAVSTSSFA